MSRFLPAVIVARTLRERGVPAAEIAGRLFGGIEEQHIASSQRPGLNDLGRLDQVVEAGLARLYDFQRHDGGWGWWKESESDRFMSAYVVWGLALARDAGVEVRPAALTRGVEFLRVRLVEEENDVNRQAWMLHALAAASAGGSPVQTETRALENVWQKRDRLTPYGLALYALATKQFGMDDRARTLARNLENGVKIDAAPDRSLLLRGSGARSDTTMTTARWGASGFWWRWQEGPVESTAMALRALSAIDPQHRLVEPAMNWLIRNRRGAQWSNTRDTAIAVLALNDYLTASGELSGDVAWEVEVNGVSVASRTVRQAEMLSAPSRFVVPESAVRDGMNQVTIRRTSGDGPLYLGAEARFFSLEEPVTAAGHEMFVKREYRKIVPRPTLLKGFAYDMVPMRDGESVRSGDRIEVVLTVEVKNDYEYLIFEDLKPAGLETVALLSGTQTTARRLSSLAAERTHGAEPAGRPQSPFVGQRQLYSELRDRKVALFADRLEQGIWEITYTMRAEAPGTFHAMPLLGGAMYVPEIRANSDEIRLTVHDRE
jgi:alpha-2-macroglobulin